MNKKVLFVDDEPNVLQAYSRSLRKLYQITTAASGDEALSLVNPEDPFAVIVSDMRMPGMDGVTLLSRMKETTPDTVRIMLTGNADQQTAIDAVNKGDIFRFLNKPCSPENMAKSVDTALEQHRLINAEKSLLESTVKGSIAALTEVLSLVKPEVFGRTTTYKELVCACAETLGIDNTWEFETLAMISLIGTVSIPDEIVSKVLLAKPVSEQERQQFERHPELGAAIVEKIPRLEDLATAIRYQLKNYDGSGVPEDNLQQQDIPIGARLLKVIIDYDNLERSGLEEQAIFSRLESSPGSYDPEVLAALASVLRRNVEAKVVTVSVTQLTEQMVLAEDLYRTDGRLLLCKGQPLSASAGERLANFWRNGGINETISVIIKEDKDTSGS